MTGSLVDATGRLAASMNNTANVLLAVLALDDLEDGRECLVLLARGVKETAARLSTAADTARGG